MAAKLKVYPVPKSASALRRFRPQVLLDVEQSFAPLPKDELPDFYGHRPRRERVHGLSEEERHRAVVCLSYGYTWELTTRVMFSPRIHSPIDWSAVLPTKRKAAQLYFRYLWRKGVKVSQVRNGYTGMVRERVMDVCNAVKEYHKQNDIAVPRRRHG